MRKLSSFLLVLIAFILTGASAFGQTDPPTPHMWVTNGNVYSVAVDGDYTYLGGSFTQVGANTGYGAKLTTTNDSPNLNFPNINGAVYGATSDGSGGWYIGGNFTKVGTNTRSYLVHINSDGTVDANWNPNPNGIVGKIIVNGNDIYVGGGFTSIGGKSISKIAKLNNSNGNADENWQPAPNNSSIHEMAISSDGNNIYVSGDFTTIGGQSRNYIAKLNTTDGAADASWNANSEGSIFRIAIDGSDVYVGGQFQIIGGLARYQLAKLNATDGSVDLVWNPDLYNSSSSTGIYLNSNGTDIYAMGDFGGTPKKYIVKLNKTDGTKDANWNPVLDYSPSLLIAVGNDIFIGGIFPIINSQIPKYLAKLDNTTGAVDNTWAPNPNNSVYALSVSGNEIYTGGLFTFLKGQTRNNIARLSTINGEVDASWNPNSNGIIRTIAVNGTSVYAGGEFTSIGGQTRNRIAKLDYSTGAATSWDANANGIVYTIAVSSDGSEIYAGGAFNGTNSIGGQTRNRIAKLDNFTGAADASWDANASGIVRTIVIDGTNIYVGGEFRGDLCIGGKWRNNIARLNTTTGAADDWAPNPSASFNAHVYTIAVSGTSVFAGGEFTSIGGKPRNYIAKLNATINTNNADPTWDPKASRYVYTLAVSGSYVYAGGEFSKFGTTYTRNRIARFSTTGDGTPDTWDPNVSGNFYSPVRSIVVNGSDIYVGGEFLKMGNSIQPYFALFTDRTLPVKLSSFTAKAEARNISLIWQTETEQNNHGFYVERKNSGANSWEEAGFVKGSGTISTPVNYEFTDKSLTTGKYSYRLKQIDFNGNHEYHNLSGEVEVGVPVKFEISQNYPNPFNPVTKIDFALPVDSKVSMMIYDVTGREIAKIVNNEFKKAGYHTVQFNGAGFSSGVYFYRIQSEKNVMTKKMLLVK